ncbi:hypothetical protein AB4559_03285 [Vibrio sp. 10N.222.51.C8]|uniref:hypothetical protein n=1 Tax=Vibrio sp. 10N.222.51.C8 TaxID=3229624 RepID=UPI00354BAB0B
MSHLYIGNVALAPVLNGADYLIDIEDPSCWNASWLDGDFTSSIWKLKNLRTPINFSIPFINGDNLTNPRYSSLLNTVKKIVFLKRSGHLSDITGTQTTRSNTQYRLARDLMTLAQYLVNNDLYNEGQGFASMTKHVFDDFIRLYVQAGHDGVSGHLDIVKGELEKLKLANALDKVLDKNGVFAPKNFLSVTGVDSNIVHFLSATSKDSLKKYCLFKEHIKGVAGNKTEFSNATPLKETRQEGKNTNDVTSKVSNSRISSWVSAVNVLSDFKIPLKDSELVSFEPFRVELKDYKELYYESRRTPDIPTNIALAYIDSAVEFVHKHGANLVNTVTDCKEQIKHRKVSCPKARKDHIMKSIKVPSNSTTKHFNVQRYNTLAGLATVQEKRDDVTVEMLLEVFQASVFILLATFACKRFNDVMPVKQGANTIGYTGLNFIKFGLSKADPIEILRAVGRPVPKVVADAFDNLIEINNMLLEQGETPSSSLFQADIILPTSLSATSEKEISRSILVRRLIQFADFVQIPTVEVNGVTSRWYLNRIHMLRRFFACAYYHTQDKKDVPALTWLMGHADTLQTMHYVTKNLSNAEMNAVEAANVIATVMSDPDGDKDAVQKLSEVFGEPTKGVTIARNAKRLEKRVSELLNKGYRVVKEVSGEIVLLHSFKNEEDASNAA